MDTSRTQITRRTIVKGAAWSVPVIAAAVAAPMAAASGDTDNNGADFYWNPPSSAPFVWVNSDGWNSTGELSTTISYRGLSAIPADAIFQLQVVFDREVTLLAAPGSWTLTPGIGPSTQFVLQAPASAGGHNLSVRFRAESPADPADNLISVSASMSVIGGGSVTWSTAPAVDSVDLEELVNKTTP
ncbi:MAG: hypothetical protein WBA87_04095 [Microbacterium sp.]